MRRAPRLSHRSPPHAGAAPAAPAAPTAVMREMPHDTIAPVVVCLYAMRRPGLARLALSATVAFAACGGGSGGAAVGSSSDVLARAEIGPQGGRIAVVTGPHAGTALQVPPGAVAVPTEFTIRLERSHPEIPSLFPVYRFEPSGIDLSAAPVTVTVRAGASLAVAGAASPPVLFRQRDLAAPWAIEVDSVVGADGTVTASCAQLGNVVAWDGTLHRLFTQQGAVLDPAEPVRAEVLGGLPLTAANGSWSVFVGRGSLASFWASPAAENVLIVHGLFGSPLDFLGSDDLIEQLSPSVRNIVLITYPSAQGVARAANALYDAIAAARKPGFGCNVVAHSMGGLVARYLVEQSHADPSRAGYRAGDAPLGAAAPNLVLLGAPNAGAEFAEGLIATLVPQIRPEELGLVQAAFDLSEGPDSFTAWLNAAYVDNPSRYHFVYGDLGAGTDGVVSVPSVLALPLRPGDTVHGFAVGHAELHLTAGSNGVAALVGALVGAP